MRIDILTLFDEYMDMVLGQSILGRARKAGYLDIRTHNFRNWATDKHSTVDDTPYGGGKGMLLKPDPICACYDEVTHDAEKKPLTVYLSPKGQVLTQEIARRYAKEDRMVFVCGHYEGVDQRVIEEIVDEELSIGDYVLTGGELACAVAVDCVCRMVEGVLDSEECFEEESHYNGLLEYPHYTRPVEFRGRRVPEVLLEGKHAEIERWRRDEMLKITKERRPDMLRKVGLTAEDLNFLEKMDTE